MCWICVDLHSNNSPRTKYGMHTTGYRQGQKNTASNERWNKLKSYISFPFLTANCDTISYGAFSNSEWKFNTQKSLPVQWKGLHSKLSQALVGRHTWQCPLMPSNPPFATGQLTFRTLSEHIKKINSQSRTDIFISPVVLLLLFFHMYETKMFAFSYAYCSISGPIWFSNQLHKNFKMLPREDQSSESLQNQQQSMQLNT